MTTIFLALTLAAPMPAETYHSRFSPEIAETIIEEAVKGEYQLHLDFDGDGELSALDAVNVLKRYSQNITNGNEFTVDFETIQGIIEENYNVECIYWEFDFVDSIPCRKYELTVDKITKANIYLEFEDDTFDNIEIEVNPFEEIVSVLN